MTKRDWQPVAGIDGFQVEMDISRPHGPVRHRQLPDGAWHDGYPEPEDIAGPGMTVTFTGSTWAARDVLADLDAHAKANGPSSDAPKDSAGR